jgi:cell division transport system ATP-binding protein
LEFTVPLAFLLKLPYDLVTMTTSVVELNRITSGYPGANILDGLSLKIGKGDLVIIEGISGAGKTTLLRVLLGARPITHGQGLVAGVTLPVSDSSQLTKLRRHVGIVFQTARFLPQETELTNVALPLAISGCSNPECRAKGTDALMNVGLLGHARKRPADLSGGEQTRLQIARALIHQPMLLLADEPFAHLDPDSAIEAETLLNKVHQRGMTILITSHRETRLSEQASKYRLEDGKLS